MMHHAPAFKRYRIDEKKYCVEDVPWIEAFRMLKKQEIVAGGNATNYRKPNWQTLKTIDQDRRSEWGM